MEINKKMLKFQPRWLDRRPWLAYSIKFDGLFCNPCFLFTLSDIGNGRHENPGAFVKYVFRRWRSAIENFEHHSKFIYHQNCAVQANCFLSVASGHTDDIMTQVDKRTALEKAENRAIIYPTIEIILFCGEQELTLRGDDDSGPLTWKTWKQRW